jgi:hypothetical protein
VSRRSFTTRILFALAVASCLARVASARDDARRTLTTQEKPPRVNSQEKSSRVKSSQSKSSESERPRDFRRVEGAPAESPTAFEFALGRFSYRVRANGNGSRTKGDDTRRFALNFGPGEEIKYLYYAQYEGGLILTCEVSGEYGGTSYALRLDQPSMRARWTTNIPATATGEPARDGSRLYVTGKDFAGAFDLEKGELLWLLDKLPGRPGEFDSFDAPEPRGREVLFRTRPVYNGAAKTVVVNRKTGKIVRVE